jgi:hypothetical protein
MNTQSLSIEEKQALHNKLGAEIAEHYYSLDGILHRNMSIKIVPISECEANDYNPNVMPKKEMALLAECIDLYGFLFPDLATFINGKWVIIDGFHRMESLKRKGKKYISIIDMSHLLIEDRMKLTVLMNRIKGMHMVERMSNLVVSLNSGLSDIDICNSLGMEAEEFIRLKQQLGVAHSYRNHPYSKSWGVK